MDAKKKVRILFLCTGNSCRSIMAEAILRAIGQDRFSVNSAGSRPAGFIHPLALHALDQLRIPAVGLNSKSWDEFAGAPLDVVITLCDSAAAESCPVFPGAPLRAHWSIPDPAFHQGDEAERARFALKVAERIRAKLEGLLGIDWAAGSARIQDRLEFLGEI